jgi:glyoxylase-like metal-dependent hydrolase (beta-lactamase superfamily II)
MLPAVQRFVSSSGARIYRLPCEAFPDLVTFAYLVLEAGPPTLVDTGSGYGDSNAQLIAALAAVKSDFSETIGLGDIRRIVITHGHIDHFGGLPFFVEQTGAEVAVHELDRRILTAYEERLIVATAALRRFLQQAGVPTDSQSNLLEMYGFSKRHVRSLPVALTLVDGMQLDGMRFIHVPGHCPGQVCIALGDILLSADHVLPGITPHQAPESITPSTGLGHYLDSLSKIRAIDGFDLALGGHERPFRDVYKRIDDIRSSHLRKLEKILDLVRKNDAPLSISEISQRLYTRVQGFHVLLALEEVGAHVEYLYNHGRLAIANLDAVERDDNPATLYRLAEC